jgi:ribonuclease P/MRP protein subunit POP5
VKHLPKHLRPRWRYLGVGIETWPDAEIDRREFQQALWYAAGNLLGDPGSADADLRVVRFSFAAGEGEAIVRVRRGEVQRGRAALACVSTVAGDQVGLRVRGVSGTVRACEERYLGRRAGGCAERSVALADAERTVSVRDGVADLHDPDGFTGATELDFEE